MEKLRALWISLIVAVVASISSCSEPIFRDIHVSWRYDYWLSPVVKGDSWRSYLLRKDELDSFHQYVSEHNPDDPDFKYKNVEALYKNGSFLNCDVIYIKTADGRIWEFKNHEPGNEDEEEVWYKESPPPHILSPAQAAKLEKTVEWIDALSLIPFVIPK